MAEICQVKMKKITRYIPRLKMLSVVMAGTIGDQEVIYRKKRILSKRLERKLA